MSDRILLLVFAVSFLLGAFFALWLALFLPDSAKLRIFERTAIAVLFLGTIGALLVIVLAATGRSSDLGIVPITAGFFIDGVILATVVASRKAVAAVFKGQDELGSVVFSPRMLIAGRYFTASYFLMVGLFKWITFAEYPFFQASGYSKAFYVFICAFECACAAGLLLKITVLPAVLTLTIEMAGAVYTHFHNYFAKGVPDPFLNSLDAFRMLVLLAYVGVATLQRDPREGKAGIFLN
jgi:hypothetical protein